MNGAGGILVGHAPLVEKVQALPCSRPIPCLKWSWYGNVNSVAVTHGSGELCVVVGMVFNMVENLQDLLRIQNHTDNS